MNPFRFFPVPAENIPTVPEEYTPSTLHSGMFPDQTALVEELRREFTASGYEQLTMRDDVAFLQNLRRQLERLNNYTFTEREWSSFWTCYFSKNSNFPDKILFPLGMDSILPFQRENGTQKGIRFFDSDFRNNQIQFFTPAGFPHALTFMVNGLPLFHLELKPRETSLRLEFASTPEVSKAELWRENRFFECIQIFAISNGPETHYTSRWGRNSHNFNLTETWTDQKGNVISDVLDFCRILLRKTPFLNLISRFCFCTSEGALLFLRPFQITASEKILKRASEFTSSKNQVSAGGYVQFAPGTGKTLTALQTAKLLSCDSNIERVFLVVNRNDLDWRSLRKFSQFQKNAVNLDCYIPQLQNQLSDSSHRLILTTIQKLREYLRIYSETPIFRKPIVLIFDESQSELTEQFWNVLTRHFPKSLHFAFTSVPVQSITERFFGSVLHSFTFSEALDSNHLLPWYVEFIPDEAPRLHNSNLLVQKLKTELEYLVPRRIRCISRYILKSLCSNSVQRRGTSILTVQSIPLAVGYYAEFRRQLRLSGKSLKIALLFGPVTLDSSQTVVEEESYDLWRLDRNSRDFMELAIADYNAQFQANFSTCESSMEEYFADVARRLTQKQLDLVIVLNHFLTGLGAESLGTLWVDRDFSSELLFQAFSRTSRSWNSGKKYGRIVCFRDQREEVVKSLRYFGGKNIEQKIFMQNTSLVEH